MKRYLLAAYLILILPGLAHGQAWSGVIAPTRAVAWNSAGVIGGVPSASWTQCGSTIGAYTGSANTINSAMAGCPANTYVQLASGTFNLNSGFVMVSNVVLRGMGANSTFVIFTGNNNCNGDGGSDVCFMGENTYYGSPWVQPGGTQAATWSGGYSQGSTSITLTSVGSSGLHVGQYIFLDQENTTSPAATGAFVCSTVSSNGCSLEGGAPGRIIGGVPYNQIQIVKITGISGSTYTISPGLYGINWSGGQNPGVWWPVGQITNSGIENLSLDHTNSGSEFGIMMTNAFNCWVSGIRSISAPRDHVDWWQAAHNTVQNSYFFATKNATTQSYGIEHFISSDDLAVNNVFQQVTAPTIIGPAMGDVFAYNFGINDTFTTPPDWMQQALAARHDGGGNYNLFEGNVTSGIWNDVFHGTGFANTFFRNVNVGWETGKTQETVPFQSYSYNREDNNIGSMMGCNNSSAGYPGPCGTPYHTIYQASNGVGATKIIYDLGAGNSEGAGATVNPDSYVATSLYRWGNYDVVHAAVQWNGAEVPSGLTDGYAQPVPGSHALAASFYYSSTPSWWTMGKPFPPIGPDVTGGTIPGYAGMAYTIPAQDCYTNTMGGPADGSGSVLPFTCTYSGGGGGTPAIAFSPTSVGYGTVTVAPPPSCPTNCTTVTLSNPGTATLTWTGFITMGGADPGDFTFISNSCPFPGVLGAGNSCAMVVQFAPTTTGARSAAITVSGTNVSGMTFTVPLSGTGTSAGGIQVIPTSPILVGMLIK